mgnify:FL=1
MVIYSIYIKRLPGFYMTYLYLPSVVLIATSLFSFYLPPGSDSKIELAVNGLLSQTVFLLLISDLLPPDANDPPYLGMMKKDCFSLRPKILTLTVLWEKKLTPTSNPF